MYISSIRKIAPETDSAETNKLEMTVALEGAKRPKLMKTTVGQQLSITSNGKKTEFSTGQADNARITGIAGDTLTNGAAIRQPNSQY